MFSVDVFLFSCLFITLGPRSTQRPNRRGTLIKQQIDGAIPGGGAGAIHPLMVDLDLSNTSLLSSSMPLWWYPSLTKKKAHAFVAKHGSQGQFVVFKKKDNTKFHVVANDAGATSAYSIPIVDPFTCTFAGQTFRSLQDCVEYIMRVTAKSPLVSFCLFFLPAPVPGLPLRILSHKVRFCTV